MRKVVYIALGIAVLAAVSSIGYSMAFTASFTDQVTSSPTISSEPAYITMGDWNTLYANGSGVGGTSTGVSFIIHDPIASSEVHPEFTFSGISEDISSLGYIKITLTGTSPGSTYDFYADVSSVNGSSVTGFNVIGTAMTVGNDGLWTGSMNIKLANGDADALSTVFGSSATLKVTSYHLEASL